MRAKCYTCDSRSDVLTGASGVPLCGQCRQPPPSATPMPPADKPLCLDDVDSELNRLRKELGWQFEEDDKRTPTMRMGLGGALGSDVTYGQVYKSVYEAISEYLGYKIAPTVIP